MFERSMVKGIYYKLAEINYSFIYLFDMTSQIKLIYDGLPLGYDLHKTKECTVQYIIHYTHTAMGYK